jgi:hypothetical protein
MLDDEGHYMPQWRTSASATLARAPTRKAGGRRRDSDRWWLPLSQGTTTLVASAAGSLIPATNGSSAAPCAGVNRGIGVPKRTRRPLDDTSESYRAARGVKAQAYTTRATALPLPRRYGVYNGGRRAKEDMTMRINWREVFKFGSGATFVNTIGNGYLFLYEVSVPFPLFGFTISPLLFGVRAIISFVLFVVFFYFGYLKPHPQPH